MRFLKKLHQSLFLLGILFVGLSAWSQSSSAPESDSCNSLLSTTRANRAAKILRQSKLATENTEALEPTTTVVDSQNSPGFELQPEVLPEPISDDFKTKSELIVGWETYIENWYILKQRDSSFEVRKNAFINLLLSSVNSQFLSEKPESLQAPFLNLHHPDNFYVELRTYFKREEIKGLREELFKQWKNSVNLTERRILSYLYAPRVLDTSEGWLLRVSPSEAKVISLPRESVKSLDFATNETSEVPLSKSVLNWLSSTTDAGLFSVGRRHFDLVSFPILSNKQMLWTPHGRGRVLDLVTGEIGSHTVLKAENRAIDPIVHANADQLIVRESDTTNLGLLSLQKPDEIKWYDVLDFEVDHGIPDSESNHTAYRAFQLDSSQRYDNTWIPTKRPGVGYLYAKSDLSGDDGARIYLVDFNSQKVTWVHSDYKLKEIFSEEKDGLISSSKAQSLIGQLDTANSRALNLYFKQALAEDSLQVALVSHPLFGHANDKSTTFRFIVPSVFSPEKNAYTVSADFRHFVTISRDGSDEQFSLFVHDIKSKKNFKIPLPTGHVNKLTFENGIQFLDKNHVLLSGAKSLQVYSLDFEKLEKLNPL